MTQEGTIMVTAVAPTEKQLNFLYKLAGERVANSLGTCGEERIENVGAWVENARPSRREVSNRIEWFLRQPQDTTSVDATPVQVKVHAEVTVTTPGVFELDGDVYVVKPNRDKTRLYAKKIVEISGERVTEADTIVKIELEYAPGVIFKLTEAHRMPLAKAEELTVRYGKCIVCGHGLKAAKSVTRGIGPVCVKYFR